MIEKPKSFQITIRDFRNNRSKTFTVYPSIGFSDLARRVKKSISEMKD